MAVPAEALEQQYMSRPHDRFVVVPANEPHVGASYDLLTDAEAFALIPRELLIGDPLPGVVVDSILPPAEEYGYKDWLFTDEPQEKWIQISSKTLRTPPRDGLDPKRLYTVDSESSNGKRTLYEAETELVYVDGWNSNRKAFVPTGVVRISSFGSETDESMEAYESSPRVDTASVQFSYEGNVFVYASMLRSNTGTYMASDGVIPLRGDVISFAIPTTKKIEQTQYKQLRFGQLGNTDVREHAEQPDTATLPVLVDGNCVVMTHYGRPYPNDGNRLTQVVEIQAPHTINGLAELIVEQGTYDEDEVSDDEKKQEPIPQNFAPMTEVFKAATQFPVSINTTVVPV